jgi:hypothetical protein
MEPHFFPLAHDGIGLRGDCDPVVVYFTDGRENASDIILGRLASSTLFTMGGVCFRAVGKFVVAE